MIPGSRKLLVIGATLGLGAGWFSPAPARAAIETDPTALYAQMRHAYDEGASKHWPFESELYYEAMVLDAGRAYSLFRPDDPNYAQVASLAVDIATQLHYNPLTSNDAALWYVNEAAAYVSKNGDDQHQAEAKALAARLDAGQLSPSVLARQAEEDALANVAAFNRDGDSRVRLVVTDVRAYNLTRDADYRSALLQHAADPETPLTRVPDPEYGEMFSLAASALSDSGFTDADRAAARAIKYRRDHSPDLQLIGRVSAVPRELRLTRTAPADEYFGRLKYSPLGVNNEVNRVNKYLDKGWGSRMEGDALQVDSAVEDWQKQYPHDGTLPAALLDAYQLLERVDTDVTKAAAERVKTILLVQYASTRQAQQLAFVGPVLSSGLARTLANYDPSALTLCSVGSHSALDVAFGARSQGLRNLIVTARGRERTYARYFARRGTPPRGCVDATLELESFAALLAPEVQARLLAENVLFVANRSFEVYLHERYSYDEIERGMRVPFFGNRRLLRAEERDEANNQYALLAAAGIRHPRTFAAASDIDTLVMVKAAHARVGFERAFFLCASPAEYAAQAGTLLAAGMVTEAGLAAARIEEYALGPSVNLNFFWSPLLDELELVGTDTRRQTNLDGLRALPPGQLAAAAAIPVRMEEAGHIATTLTESMLEQAFALGERFVTAARAANPPGVIGPFALQCIIVAGPPKDFVVYDVSLRIPGSPGTRYTPYSAYLWGRDVSVGERIAMEVVMAREAGRLGEVLT